MTRRSPCWLAALALLLGACVAADGGAGLPETVATAPPGTEPVPAQGVTGLAVRSLVPNDEGRPVEVAGADCTAASGPFRAEFQTPARLVLPDLGPASAPLRVDCRIGEARGAMRAEPQLGWAGGLGGWPAIGVTVGTGSSDGVGVGVGWYGGGAGVGRDITRYPDMRIVLRQP
jgi:hypothetical protein